MAKFLVLWRRNPMAPWPKDPVEYSKLIEKIGGDIDNCIKSGEIKEHGHFLDGSSGYTIWDVEAADIFRNLSMLVPYYEWEIHEFIPFERSREILRGVFKALGESAK